MDLQSTLKKVKNSSRVLSVIDDSIIREALLNLAQNLERNIPDIILANKKDLDALKPNDPIRDRVLLNEERIKSIAASVREIANYDSPIGEILEHKILQNKLDLCKVRTPIGVVGIIFEARPNVVIDIFTLCYKSKNACVLKGGSKSAYSNEILVKLIQDVLENKNMVALLPNDREIVAEFLKADDYVDVIVPRGGKGLIDFVRANSLIPVIETGAGVCHTYFDETGELEKGKLIIFNAKTNRPSVCNALDTLIIHSSRLEDLKALCEKLSSKKVEIFADNKSYPFFKNFYDQDLLYEATNENFGTEYLSLKMSVKVVDSLYEAIDHINTFGSGHSEAIISENEKNTEKFLNSVDAAAVYVNASTRFTDGGEFGLGAEVGISTQKLHARGPMGIKELTSYKWIIRGHGQIRE